MKNLIDDELTQKIINCAYTVSNELGVGFLEKVYENALKHELIMNGFSVEQQFPIPVHYKGLLVGDFYADLLVNDSVIVELKVAREYGDFHTVQCLNYLRATNKQTCLLLNFGKPKVEIRRFDNIQT